MYFKQKLIPFDLGPTERKILDNVETIVDESLSMAKLKADFNFKNEENAKSYLIDKITFYAERGDVSHGCCLFRTLSVI